MSVTWAWPFSYSGLPPGQGTAFSISLTDGAGCALNGAAFGTDKYNDTPIGVCGTTDAGYGVYGQAFSDSGYGVYGQSPFIGVYGTSSKFDAVVGETYSDVHAGVAGRNWTAGGNGGVGVYGAGGMYAGRFDGDHLINGNGNVTGNHSIGGDSSVTGNHTINGSCFVIKDVILVNSLGADCAEDFDVDDVVEPGTVLVIGPEGTLTVCREAYDTRIAGVVSGAGELRPALVLHRFESERSRAPIALIGKVFCKADASAAPINPGDLLTTSATPGHAMKVLDRSNAVGAILGKALCPLEGGCGLIQILVSLR
jgi:hypothetical protein